MDMEQFLMQFVTTPVELLAAVVGMLIVLELITLQKIKKMEKQNRNILSELAMECGGRSLSKVWKIFYNKRNVSRV